MSCNKCLYKGGKRCAHTFLNFVFRLNSGVDFTHQPPHAAQPTSREVPRRVPPLTQRHGTARLHLLFLELVPEDYLCQRPLIPLGVGNAPPKLPRAFLLPSPSLAISVILLSSSSSIHLSFTRSPLPVRLSPPPSPPISSKALKVVKVGRGLLVMRDA